MAILELKNGFLGFKLKISAPAAPEKVSWRLRRHFGAIWRLRRQKWPKNGQKWPFLAFFGLFLVIFSPKNTKVSHFITILRGGRGLKAFCTARYVPRHYFWLKKSGKSPFPPTLGAKNRKNCKKKGANLTTPQKYGQIST